MWRVLSIFCLLALMLATWHKPAQAAPELVLRERIDIHLEPIRRVDSTIVVKGRLLQRGDGDGASYISMRLRFDERWVTILSDGDGYFSQRFVGSEGEHILSVDVEESLHFDAAHLEMADFDVEKRPLELQLSAPSTLADTESELDLMIHVSSEGQPLSLALEIFLGSTGGPLHRVASAQTNHQGEALVKIAQEQLGKAGRKRVELRFAGDESFDAATASSLFQITSSATVKLEAGGSEFDYGDTIPVSGRLEDGRGEAIKDAVISLEVQGQRIASAKTDEWGDFRIPIDSEELGSGTSIAVQAVYRPIEDWKAAAHSPPITITIGQRKPFPLSLALAAFVVTGLGLVTFVGLRTRPWERFRASSAVGRDEEVVAEDAPEIPPVTGLSAGRPKLSRTFRKAHFMDFEGTVRDAVTKECIGFARVEVEGPSSQVLNTNVLGSFRTSALYEGEHLIRISADGYVSEQCRVTTPHRGEFHSTTINMLPVREKIFSLYKDALRPRLPDPKLWGIWTPRQILDHIKSSHPNASLTALTDFVEESFFSQRNPHEDVLPSARELIRAFQKEDRPRVPRP
ncbi:MAG: carboxypeptidase regulatory-like domain-containing protein [Myxococcales bacterium]|nr:carboxypeptidase regulatory-like domain-containing protein [Myxococcales bacterium]